MEQRNESRDVSSVRRIRWYQSLTFQLGATWTVITILSILVLGVVLIGIAQRTQRENILRQQEKSARQVALLISSYINGVVNELSLFEGTQSLLALAPDEQKAALEQLLIRRRTVFSQIALLNSNGRETVKVSTTRTYTPGDMVSQAESEAFRTAVGGETYVSPIFVSPESGLLSVQVALPVKASGGRIAGILVAEANVARLWQDVARIEIGETGYAYLVDAEGRFLAYQEPSAVLQRYGEDMKSIPPVSDFLAGAQEEQTLLEYPGLNGQKVVGLFTPIPGTGWAAIVELPTQEAFASVRQMQIYLLGLTALGLFITVGLGFVLLNRTLRPILQLTDLAREVGQGNLTIEAPVRTKDEVGVLATVFNSMTTQLRQTLEGLEQKVTERTRALQTSTEVSRNLSSILDQQRLVIEVVEALRSAFNYYHVHIYLFDEAGENLVMMGGTGEVGKILLERGHKLPRGRGLVGRAAETKETVLVPETAQDPNWLPNPLLPETQAEIAVPIMVGEQVLGVLDVQNNVANSLKEQDAELIGSIANQVGIALQNIRQYETSRRLAIAVEQAVDGIAIASMDGFIQFANQAWAEIHGYENAQELIGQHLSIFHTEDQLLNEVTPFNETVLAKGENRAEIGHKHKDGSTFPTWMSVRALRDTQGAPIALVASAQDITERKRTEELIRRRAEREAFLNAISQKIQSTLSVEAALQVATRELGHALGRKKILAALESNRLRDDSRPELA